ncbi:MAG: ABC transporter substrate-binding protein [Acidimicrobiales bacterium]
MITPSARPTAPARLALAVALVAALVMAACGGDESPSAEATDDSLRPVTLMLNWTPNSHHAGIYLAVAEGHYRDAGLDVTIIEPATTGTTQAVGTGRADFGLSVAETILPARAAGVPVVSIATVLPFNDSSLMFLGSAGIERPRDLAGRTYGGFGGALETELISALVECDGGDPDEVTYVEVGNVDYLSGLEQGRFDFVWVFEGWDVLRATDVVGADVDSIAFVDHQDCIPDWYTPVFIANEQTLADDPDLVDAFLAATTEGYRAAAADPQAAADALLAAAPELDDALVRAGADYHGPLYRTSDRPWGWQDPATWERFEAFVRSAGLTEDEVDTAAVFTNDHLPDDS